jgi:hypothetical protein
MAAQSHREPAGPRRTYREFVDQLAAWGFAQRKDDGVHRVFRGPHGGTLRVVRSLLGHADAPIVDKAAQLAGVTAERFWAGPDGPLPGPQQPQREAHAEDAAPPRRVTDRDRVTSLVLGVHAEADRPLGFDQVVELTGDRVSRDQVRTASAQLCREGDLDRIRSGVYQWSGGARARSADTATPPVPEQQQAPAPAASGQANRASATELFDQLFPSGVRMTADLLADYQRWAELTEKLAVHARAS